jgi:hypothetical protein
MPKHYSISQEILGIQFDTLKLKKLIQQIELSYDKDYYLILKNDVAKLAALEMRIAQKYIADLIAEKEKMAGLSPRDYNALSFKDDFARLVYLETRIAQKYRADLIAEKEKMAGLSPRDYNALSFKDDFARLAYLETRIAQKYLADLIAEKEKMAGLSPSDYSVLPFKDDFARLAYLEARIAKNQMAEKKGVAGFSTEYFNFFKSEAKQVAFLDNSIENNILCT